MNQSELLDQLQSRVEIQELLNAYCRNVDLFRPEEVARLFAEECLVDHGPGSGPAKRNPTAITMSMTRGLSQFTATSHHISNIDIWFESPDRATGMVYVYAWHRFLDQERPDGHLWGQYHDVYVRGARGWRIVERTFKAAGQKDFPIEQHSIGRAPVTKD